MISSERRSWKDIAKGYIPGILIDLVRLRHERKERKQIEDRNSRVIRDLLENTQPIKLELGAGVRTLEGWTSVDANNSCALNLDLTKPLPFPDNSVSMIYSSHVLEHFTISELSSLLGECRRILKPGGAFSASVPNARIYLEAYQRPDRFDPNVYCGHKPAYRYYSRIDYVNYMAYMDGNHKYMFDEENIIPILKEAGFRHVVFRDFDGTIDPEARRFQSLYVHAEK